MSNVIALAAAKIYQQDNLILEGVQLELAAQSFAYLIGKTGSGKSSLLKTLYAEIPLLEGDGEVCGYKLTGLKRKEIPYLRRKIGVVFQDFQLLTDRNVLDNLKFVLGATGWKDKNKSSNARLIVYNLWASNKKRIPSLTCFLAESNKGYQLHAPC